MINLIAQIGNPVVNPKIGDPGLAIALSSGGNTGVFILQLFLRNFVRIGFIVGAVVFLFMLIWGGIEYISAGGEKEKISSSTKRITNALIGIFILLSVYALSKLLNLVFGINILKLDIPII